MSTAALNTSKPFPVALNQETVLLQLALARRQSIVLRPSNLRFALFLTGNVATEVVREALRQVVCRHDALRVSFVENTSLSPLERDNRLQEFRRTQAFAPGVYMQSITEVRELSLEIIDLRSSDKAALQAALQKLTYESDRKPFGHHDTLRVRAHLIRIRETKALFVLFLDHLVSDGLSLRIIEEELKLFLLEACRDNRTFSRRPASFSFPEFALLQRQKLSTNYFDPAIAYWRGQWADFASSRLVPEDFPFVRLSPSGRHHLFRTESADLDPDESRTLRDFALQSRATLFMIFLVAFSITLRTYTGKARLGIWSHLGNRLQTGAINGVGFFVHSHLLGMDLSGSPTVSELIRQARDVVRMAITHQEMPLPHLWNSLQCAPRFTDARVLLDFREASGSTVDEAPSALQIVKAELPESSSPRFSSFGAYIVGQEKQITISVQYDSGVFEHHGVKRFVSDFRQAVLDLLNSNFKLSRIRMKEQTEQRSKSLGEFLVLQSGRIPSSPLRQESL